MEKVIQHRELEQKLADAKLEQASAVLMEEKGKNMKEKELVRIIISLIFCDIKIGLPHDKTNKMACAPSEDSDQPRHSPSLIRVFSVRMQKACVLSYPLSAK